MSDKPSFLLGRSLAPREAKIRERWRCALASLAGVDRGVAQVYEAVKDAGQLRQTVFIFISDNGQFYGEHRIAKGKVLPYEEALHLPLVIRAPRRYLNGASRVKKSAAGRKHRPRADHPRPRPRRPVPGPGHCRTMDGRSLMPLLKRSGRWPRDRALLTEYSARTRGRYATCEFAGISTRDALYVEHSRVFDPGTGQCVADRPGRALRPEAGPVRAPQPVLRGKPRQLPGRRLAARPRVRLGQLRNCAGIAGRDDRVGGRPFCE